MWPSHSRCPPPRGLRGLSSPSQTWRHPSALKVLEVKMVINYTCPSAIGATKTLTVPEGSSQSLSQAALAESHSLPNHMCAQPRFAHPDFLSKAQNEAGMHMRSPASSVLVTAPLLMTNRQLSSCYRLLTCVPASGPPPASPYHMLPPCPSRQMRHSAPFTSWESSLAP